MKITIIGMGLIGGSMALVLRSKLPGAEILGVEANEGHARKAIELGLVNSITNLEKAVQASELVIVATPVDTIITLLPLILKLNPAAIVMDAGSTKGSIIEAANTSGRRGRFVATHPMWGTEYSGPEAALATAFNGKAAVICDREDSDADALELVEKIYDALGMHLVYMNSEEHDLHVAYVSHISHITSFALANTVLEKEREDNAIFELASGGFESTVRLAKSNPATWTSIFRQNRENVLEVLNEHISQLKKFKACLEKDNYEFLEELMTNANRIKRIIK